MAEYAKKREQDGNRDQDNDDPLQDLHPAAGSAVRDFSVDAVERFEFPNDGRPIVMTSSQPVGQRAPGDWGGLVLPGKAQVNVAGGASPPGPLRTRRHVRMVWRDKGRASNRTNDLSGQAAHFSGTNNALAQQLLGGNRGSAGNILILDPALRRPLYTNDPDFLPRAGSPVFRANWVQPPDDGFFDQWARWNGAFGDVDWTEEWTVWPQESDLRP